jgi:hypothetical protein
MMTTTLPTTSIEGEALAYAKECVRFIHADSIRQTGTSWFSKEGGHMLLRRVMKQHAMSSPFGMDEIVCDAIAGWPDAHEALGELIGAFHALGQKLPPQLASYDVHAWRQRISGLGRRQKADHITRNIAIAVILDAIVKNFPPLKATQSRQSRKPPKHGSAASIVAQALREELAEHHLLKPDARAIEGMWENCGPRLLAFAADFRNPIPLPVPKNCSTEQIWDDISENV